jgi:hypothetical protein
LNHDDLTENRCHIVNAGQRFRQAAEGAPRDPGTLPTVATGSTGDAGKDCPIATSDIEPPNPDRDTNARPRLGTRPYGRNIRRKIDLPDRGDAANASSPQFCNGSHGDVPGGD